jgi:hypothetical protein
MTLANTRDRVQETLEYAGYAKPECLNGTEGSDRNDRCDDCVFDHGLAGLLGRQSLTQPQDSGYNYAVRKRYHARPHVHLSF